MRIIVLTTLVALTASASFAEIPKMNRGNHYGAGRTVAETGSSRHVEGRDYHNSATGETHRRVLIYNKQSGEFKGFAKTGRLKGDATTRHYFR